MNPLIVLMLIFFILGIVDKIIGGRLGFSAGLDRGLAQMGALAMSMAGFYCIGVTLRWLQWSMTSKERGMLASMRISASRASSICFFTSSVRSKLVYAVG